MQLKTTSKFQRPSSEHEEEPDVKTLTRSDKIISVPALGCIEVKAELYFSKVKGASSLAGEKQRRKTQRPIEDHGLRKIRYTKNHLLKIYHIVGRASRLKTRPSKGQHRNLSRKKPFERNCLWTTSTLTAPEWTERRASGLQTCHNRTTPWGKDMEGPSTGPTVERTNVDPAKTGHKDDRSLRYTLNHLI